MCESGTGDLDIPPLRINQRNALALFHPADACYGNAGKPGRSADHFLGGGRKRDFVIVARRDGTDDGFLRIAPQRPQSGRTGTRPASTTIRTFETSAICDRSAIRPSETSSAALATPRKARPSARRGLGSR